ncbi:MAG: hypothetical protein RBR93_12685 [Aliarcobacter butzleri]|nr:hypothetical protein [Aliarcobacter butzleri]
MKLEDIEEKLFNWEDITKEEKLFLLKNKSDNLNGEYGSLENSLWSIFN